MPTTPLNSQSNSSPVITKAGEFRPLINVPFVVKDLFKPGEVGMIAGAPGLGKSTITSAIAAHAAQGRNFGGLSVKNAVVIYYAAEDPYGVLCRAHPYMRDPACANSPFYVVHGAPNLLDPGTPEKVARYVSLKQAEHGCDQALVIFDTLNRCVGEADENSSTAMGTVIGNATHIAQNSKSSVIFVHHTGNANPDRPRGSSAFHSNVDCLCLLNKAPESVSENVVLLNPLKQKNAQTLDLLPFKLSALEIGTDNEGRVATVPMAIPMEPRDFTSALKSKSDYARPSNATTERRDDIERVLQELSKTHPEAFFSATEIAARSGSVFNEVRGSDSLRKAVSRSLDALVKARKAEKGKKGYRYATGIEVVERE